MKKILLVLVFHFLNFAVTAKYYTTLEILSGNSQGTSGNIKYWSVSCGQPLKLRVDLHDMTGAVVEHGITCNWYVDSIFRFNQGGVVEFEHSGLIYTPSCDNYLIRLDAPSPGFFHLNMEVHNFSSMHLVNGAMVYRIPEGQFLEASAVESNNCETRKPPAQWYVNGIYYASTLPDEALFINKPGLITAIDTINDTHPIFNILLYVDERTSSDFPFPFSKTSDINMHQLRYAVTNAVGKTIEEGIFSGEVILRNQKSQQPLPEGIYFVIYYDALDNRQVLTDKVFINP